MCAEAIIESRARMVGVGGVQRDDVGHSRNCRASWRAAVADRRLQASSKQQARAGAEIIEIICPEASST